MYFTDPSQCGYCQNNGVVNAYFDENGDCPPCKNREEDYQKETEAIREYFEAMRELTNSGR